MTICAIRCRCQHGPRCHRSERQFGIPVTPGTLECDKEKGLKVRPEHIHEALREFASVAAHTHARKFPLGLADKGKLQGLWG